MSDVQIVRSCACVRMCSEVGPFLQAHSRTTQEGWFLGSDAMGPYKGFMTRRGGDHYHFLAERP